MYTIKIIYKNIKNAIYKNAIRYLVLTNLI